MKEKDAKIQSCLGQLVFDIISENIIDGAYGYYGEQLELVGFNESHYSNGQVIEFRFNRGMNNDEFKTFFEEFKHDLQYYTDVEYKIENITYMSTRIFFKLLKR